MHTKIKSNIPDENRRVLEIIDKYFKGNESQFSKEIGISQPRINRLFSEDARSGKYPNISFDILKAILEKFEEISPDWLISGKGAMLRVENFEQENSEPSILKLNYKDVYNEECEGEMITGNTLINKLKSFGVEFLIEKNKAFYGCKAISVDSFIISGREYFLCTDQGMLIKKLYPVEGDENSLRCISDYDGIPFLIDKKSIKKLAIVLSKLVNY